MPKTGAASEGERVRPRNPIEEKLWEVFSRNFDSEDIGVTDNFFEMGGDSLLALRIVVDVTEAIQQDVGVDTFLTHPTIEQLAHYLASEPVATTEVEKEAGLDIDFSDLAHISVEEASDELRDLDAVALTYIPEVLASMSGLARDEISERLFGGRPRLSNRYELSEGNIGVVMLPHFESDFHKNPESGRQQLAALRWLERLGRKMCR